MAPPFEKRDTQAENNSTANHLSGHAAAPFEESRPLFPFGFDVYEIASDFDNFLRHQAHDLQPASLARGPLPPPHHQGSFIYLGREYGSVNAAQGMVRAPQPSYNHYPRTETARATTTTNTINPRHHVRRAPDEALAGSVFESIERSASPASGGKSEATRPVADFQPQQSPAKTLDPQSHALMQQLNLPQSIIDYGFEPRDFDPTTRYDSPTKANPSRPAPSSFKPFPPDLAEEHIFNANPRYLVYDNILPVAPKYSNYQLYQKINEGRPVHVINGEATVGSRIRTALASKADKEKTPGGYEALKQGLKGARKDNGVYR